MPNSPRSEDPPHWSDLIYIRIPRRDIAYFKFILESHDHLALPSVVDAGEAAIQLRFAPGSRREVLDLLHGLAGEMDLEILQAQGAVRLRQLG